MFIRAYLFVSPEKQHAERAANALDEIAREYSHAIVARYIEKASDAQPERPELRRLLDEAYPGDVLLVETIDRLFRLPVEDWRKLRGEIEAKGLRVVSVDLPTSHQGMANTASDEFTPRILDAINSTTLDIMATAGQEDYKLQRQRQVEDATQTKTAYPGQQSNRSMRQRIADGLAAMCQ